MKGDSRDGDLRDRELLGVSDQEVPVRGDTNCMGGLDGCKVTLEADRVLLLVPTYHA